MKFFLGLASPRSPPVLRAAPKSPNSSVDFESFRFAEADDIDDEMPFAKLLIVADASSNDHDWRRTFSGCRLDDGRVVVAIPTTFDQLSVHGKLVTIQGKSNPIEPDFVLMLQAAYDATSRNVIRGLQAAGFPSVLNPYDVPQERSSIWPKLQENHALPLVSQSFQSSIRSITESDLYFPTRIFVENHVLDVADKRSWRNIQTALRIGGGGGANISAVIQPIIRSDFEMAIHKMGENCHRCFCFVGGNLVEETEASKTHVRWIEKIASDLGGLTFCNIRIAVEIGTGAEYITDVVTSHVTRFEGHLEEDSEILRDLAMAQMNGEYKESIEDLEGA